MKTVKFESLSTIARHALSRACGPGRKASIPAVLKIYGLRVALLVAMCREERDIQELFCRISEAVASQLDSPRVKRTRKALRDYLDGKVSPGYVEKCGNSVGSPSDNLRFSSHRESEKLTVWMAVASVSQSLRSDAVLALSWSKDPEVLKTFKEWANE